MTGAFYPCMEKDNIMPFHSWKAVVSKQHYPIDFGRSE